MQWRKASDSPKKAGWYHTDVGLIQFDLVGDGKFGTEPPFEWMWLNRGHGMVTKWLDESPPASAVEEAARMYPPDPENDDWYTDGQVSAMQQQAHITCAGMYTDTIDKLKNDVATLEAENKALIEEIQNWKDELRDQAREHRNNR